MYYPNNQLYSSKKFDSITNKKNKQKNTNAYAWQIHIERVTTVSNRPNKHYTIAGTPYIGLIIGLPTLSL